MILQRFLSYAPALMLFLVGILLVALFRDQPGLTVNLSGFGLGSGTADAAGENISVGWFAVLASIAMYIVTWWKERRAPQPDPEAIRSRGLGNMAAETAEAVTARMSRAYVYMVIGFSILAGLLFLGLIL